MLLDPIPHQGVQNSLHFRGFSGHFSFSCPLDLTISRPFDSISHLIFVIIALGRYVKYSAEYHIRECREMCPACVSSVLSFVKPHTRWYELTVTNYSFIIMSLTDTQNVGKTFIEISAEYKEVQLPMNSNTGTVKCTKSPFRVANFSWQNDATTDEYNNESEYLTRISWN